MNEENFFKIIICGLICIMAVCYAIGNESFPGEVETLLIYSGLIFGLALIGDDTTFTQKFPVASFFITILLAIIGFILSIFVSYQLIRTFL